MARALRAALEKGDCCPVGGQKVHDLPHDDAPASARDLDGELRLAEAALAGYAGETARLEAAAGRAQAEARDAAAACAPLEAALAGHDPDAEDARYREKQAALAAYQEKLTADEAALRALSESAAAARARLSGCEARRALAETELARAEAAGKSAKALWEEKRAQLAAACAQAGVTSFEEADRALRENDRLRAEADARRVEREQTRAQRTLKREAALAQSHRAETEVAALTANLTALNRQIEGLDGDIRARVGGETDISGYNARLTAAHEKIVSDRRRAEEARACAQEKCNSANLRAESAKGQLQTRRSALALSRTRLDAALRENRFENAEAALAAQLPPGEIDALEEAVAAHERLALLNAQQTEETEQALSGRSLTREDWEAAKSLTQTSEAELRAWEAEETRRESRWKTLAGTWEKAEAAQKKHAARGHTLALLDELKRVLAGNRFVQYAAAERMSVLAQSAGQTLLDITRGGYSLISDDKGAFWVVDNKNGGVRRPPATLSGGETFLASLALALSLSAQIQMTNDAPLELFFLDEGFGTLDESLLGEVFDALEKLPNPARAIGLISHVEEIKNRVPVKLVVKAATGGQGSQVNIEWT